MKTCLEFATQFEFSHQNPIPWEQVLYWKFPAIWQHDDLGGSDCGCGGLLDGPEALREPVPEVLLRRISEQPQHAQEAARIVRFSKGELHVFSSTGQIPKNVGLNSE